ncbi:MAG: glycosyltransferase family 4 protein [Verrucomicrobiales bacterium]|nr:glycosyltransferase family 4 protein [Verrucomicrobiales bacterium]
MRIIHTATAYYPSVGGAQLHWFTIGRMLHERGHTVTALAQWKDQRNRYLLDSTILAPWENETYDVEGIRVHRVQPSWIARLWMAPLVPFCFAAPEVGYAPMSRYFAARFGALVPGADIVHNIRIGREHFSWASYYLARRRGARFHITPNYSPRMQTRLGGLVMRHFYRLLRRSDGVFVFTKAEAEEMERLGVARERICQIGVGPLLSQTWNAEEFRARYGIRKHMVLFLGQKLPYKGFDVLLAAAPKVWKRLPETSFVFIGPHYNDSERQIGSLRDPRIIDIPRVQVLDPLKASALAAADVFALPSRQEGIGGVYIEAWAMSKPVIGCRIPFLTIEDGVDGFLVDQDADALSARLVELLEKPDLARTMGLRGRAKVDREYSWSSIVDRVEAFYGREGRISARTT